ncbi:MAG: extracellular solute-binding protein [Treponema sp.]|nr:extracellular solute-binding protein [Treponema sp.]
MQIRKATIAKAGIILILAGTLLFTGCRRGDGAQAGQRDLSGGVPELTSPVEITVWNTWSDHHVTQFQQIIDEFNAANPMITVIQQPQPLANFIPNVIQAVRNRVGPDFINTFSSEAVNFVAEGRLVNLTPYLNDPRVGIPNFQSTIPAGMYGDITQFGDGNVYMIPIMSTGPIFFYNKTLYDSLGLSVPRTWSDLERNGRIITAHTGRPSFGTDSIVDLFQSLIMQAGSGYLDVNTKSVSFNNQIGLDRLTWFSGLVQEGIFRLVGADNFFSNPFGSEAVASYIGSSAGIGFVAAAVGDRFEFAVAPMMQEGPVDFVPNWGGGFVVFTSTQAREQASYEFLRYLSRPEIAARWSMEFGATPIPYAAQNLPAFQTFMQQNIAARALQEQSARIGWLPSIPGAAMVRTEIDKMMEVASLGLMTPTQALAEAERASNQELRSQ